MWQIDRDEEEDDDRRGTGKPQTSKLWPNQVNS